MGCPTCHGKGWVSRGAGRTKIRCPGHPKPQTNLTRPQTFPQQDYPAGQRQQRGLSAESVEAGLARLTAHQQTLHRAYGAATHQRRTPKCAPSISRDADLFHDFARRYFTTVIPPSEAKARDIASVMHAGQACQTGEPYIKHPATVARLVRTTPTYATLTPQQREWAVQAAWLHDTLEDTPLTVEDLAAAGFHPEVIKAVVAVTARKGEAKIDYYQRVKDAGPVALTVKLGDLAHNTNEQRRLELPGSPKNPVGPGEENRWERLGKKYWLAYTVLGVVPPAHLAQFAVTV